MTADEMMPHLERWAAVVTDLEAQLEALGEIVGSLVESPLFDAAHAAIGLATELTAERIGHSGDWLEWFHLENDMGEHGLEAGRGFTMRPIRTLRDMAVFLAEEAP